MKCITPGCQNESHQGRFVGDVCSPCFEYLVYGKGKFSQAYRNDKELEKELKDETGRI